MKLKSSYEISHSVKCRPVWRVAFELSTKEIKNIEKDIKAEMDKLVEIATKFIENKVEDYGKPETICRWYDIYGTNVTFWVSIRYPNVEDWNFEWTTSWFDTE